MNLIEKKKFEEEFIRDLILYSEYDDIHPIQQNVIFSDEFKKH
jgi:hypothetical protein